MIPQEAIEAARAAIRKESMKIHGWGESENAVARAALEAAAPYLRAQALEGAAKELAQLPYVKPDEPGRAEYESMLAIRRGNTDGWLLARAVTERGQA